MGVLIGFLFGYVVGAKAGPEGYERLQEAWQSITESAEFQGLVATATAFVQDALARGGTAVADYLEAARSDDGRPGRTGFPGAGDLAKMVGAIADSPAVQELLSGGAALLGGVLERGTAAFEQGGLSGRG
jgi:hypothetical protein